MFTAFMFQKYHMYYIFVLVKYAYIVWLKHTTQSPIFSFPSIAPIKEIWVNVKLYFQFKLTILLYNTFILFISFNHFYFQCTLLSSLILFQLYFSQNYSTITVIYLSLPPTVKLVREAVREAGTSVTDVGNRT